MKIRSIQAKVLVVLMVCMVFGTGSIIGLMRYFTVENSKAIATEAVTGSQKLFGILEAREISKMTAVSEVLAADPQVRDAFAAKDRGRLLELTAPLYPGLKSEGITNWMFHTPEPAMSVFLRLHNPAKYGDQLNRFMDKEVVRTHSLVSGNELARAGFAVRVIRPVDDSKGKVAGYVEFGEELGQFIHTLKSQTGNDYAILLNKKFVDQQFWADSSATWKRRNNWDDNPGFVVADNTTANEEIIRFQGDLAAIPDTGTVLERYRDGNAVFVRGLFPIRNAAGDHVGAMFVVRDISATYAAMRHTQEVLLVATVLCFAVGVLLLLKLLDRVIFRRLKHIITVATRLVGGDFETAIKADSDDEVGQLEQLFEQFRNVFIDVLGQVAGQKEE